MNLNTLLIFKKLLTGCSEARDSLCVHQNPGKLLLKAWRKKIFLIKGREKKVYV